MNPLQGLYGAVHLFDGRRAGHAANRTEAPLGRAPRLRWPDHVAARACGAQVRGAAATLVASVQASAVPDGAVLRGLAAAAAALLRSIGARCGPSQQHLGLNAPMPSLEPTSKQTHADHACTALQLLVALLLITRKECLARLCRVRIMKSSRDLSHGVIVLSSTESLGTLFSYLNDRRDGMPCAGAAEVAATVSSAATLAAACREAERAHLLSGSASLYL